MKSITILCDGDSCPNCSEYNKPKPLERVPLCDMFHQCICIECRELLTINPGGNLTYYDFDFIVTVSDPIDRIRLQRRIRLLYKQMKEIERHLFYAKKLIYG